MAVLACLYVQLLITATVPYSSFNVVLSLIVLLESYVASYYFADTYDLILVAECSAGLNILGYILFWLFIRADINLLAPWSWPGGPQCLGFAILTILLVLPSVLILINVFERLTVLAGTRITAIMLAIALLYIKTFTF